MYAFLSVLFLTAMFLGIEQDKSGKWSVGMTGFAQVGGENGGGESGGGEGGAERTNPYTFTVEGSESVECRSCVCTRSWVERTNCLNLGGDPCASGRTDRSHTFDDPSC